MNDPASPATLSNQPRPLTIDGVTYLVHPLTLDDFGKLQAWVQEQFPDPLQVAADRLDLFPVPVQKHLVAMAIEQASKPRPRLGQPEADALVRSMDGTLELMRIAIAKGDPSFTRDKARALYARMNLAHLSMLYASTGADVVLSDPKAETTKTPSPS
jgi:hypothetical protein